MKAEEETDLEECMECGGDVEVEHVGDYQDWVCQDCGRVISGGEYVEHEEATEEDGIVEEL